MKIRAHPRIRGEYILDDQKRATHKGSPPHTRGILSHVFRFLFSSRLTPAYAGNTLLDRCDPRREEAHPRIRGEYR